MEYLDLAKCGLLEQVYRSSTGLPLWQSVTVLTLFVESTLAGVLLALWRQRVTNIGLPLRHIAVAIAVLAAVAAAAAVIIGGIQYLLFLLRMTKDGVFCTYFLGSRSLSATQVVALATVSVFNIGLAISYGLEHLRRPRRKLSVMQAFSWGMSSLIVCVAYSAIIALIE